MLGPPSRAGTEPGRVAPASGAMVQGAATAAASTVLPPRQPVRRNGRASGMPGARSRPAVAMVMAVEPGQAVVPPQGRPACRLGVPPVGRPGE
eukprot:15312769-Heterocapsa_arctica.AAC.1